MSGPLGTALGRNLLAFRTAESCPPAEFAARLGVEPDYLAALERGDVDPDLETVEAMASEIGMEPLLLLEATPRRDEATSKAMS